MRRIEGEKRQAEYLTDRFSIEQKDKHFEFITISKIKNTFNSQLKIVEKNKMEVTKIYHDTWPLLSYRRKIYIFTAKISDLAYFIIKSKVFEYCSLFVIVINTVLMIISDPASDNSILNRSEVAFFVIYSVELSLKIFGMGLFTKKIGFFRNPWNILDFIIVMGSMLNILLKNLSVNLSALRSLRVLRPLKTISSVKSLKNIILTIFSSLPFLKDIYIILLFMYILFGITGLHLFQGVLHAQCYDPSTRSYPILNFIAQSSYCDSDSICPGISICLDSYSNPFYGQTNFDDVFGATLMAFQASTTENWSTIMYFLFSAFSPVMAGITITYFVVLLILINFILNNLMLAVIVVKFNETHKMLEKLKIETQHSEMCICNSGFNYSQMKACGFFLNFSNLSVHSKLKAKSKQFVYKNIRQTIKPPSNLKVIFDYRFVIIETLLKQNDHPDKQNSINRGIFMSGFKSERKTSLRMPMSLIEQTRFSKESSKKSRIKLKNFSKIAPSKKTTFEESKIIKNEDFDFAFNTLENKPLLLEEKQEKDIQMQKDTNKNPFVCEEQEQHESFGSSQSYSFEEVKMDERKEKVNIKQPFVAKKESITKKIRKCVRFNENNEDFDQLKSSQENIFDHEFQQNVLKSVRGISFSKKNTFNERRTNMSRRRTFKSNNEGSTSQSTRRLSMRPILAEPNLEEQELEKIGLKKDQMKAEKEFNSFTNSKLNLLKLDFNPCSFTDEANYQEMIESILPSLVQKKILAEQKMRQEEFLRSKILFIYNSKFLTHLKKKDKNNTSGTNSGNLDYDSRNNTLNHENGTQRNLAGAKSTGGEGGGSRTKTETLRDNTLQKPVTRFHEDVLKISLFYFYSFKCPDNVTDVHEGKNNKIQTKTSGSDEIQSRKLRPATSKQKSKNFASIKVFFNEEYFQPTDTLPICRSVNFRLYQGLIHDSIIKQKVIHTNWSGTEVEFPSGSFDKTIHVFNKLNTEIHEMWLPGVIGKFNIFRRYIRYFFNINAVEVFFVGLVLMNTVIMSLDGLVTNTVVLESTNTYLTIIFTIEICLKFIGLGFVEFYNDIFNIFDAIIVSLSLTEIAIGTGSQILSAIKVIRVLRTVRILRISRILRNLKFMRTLIKIFQITLEQFVYITLLLILFLTIFSLIGMQFYAGKWTFLGPGEVVAQNFETFIDAFLAMVDIMSIVNWNDTQTLMARTDVHYLISCFYLISWIFIGNYILLNLFIAVLLEGFSSAVMLNQIEDLNNEFEGIEKIVKNEIEEADKNASNEIEKKMENNKYLSFMHRTDDDLQDERNILKNTIIYNFDNQRAKEKEDNSANENKLLEDLKNREEIDSLSSEEHDISKYLFKDPQDKKEQDIILDSIKCEESLFLFDKHGFIRKLFIRMITHSWFESFILFVIFVSSMHLVISTWSDASWNETTFQFWLDIIDYTVNGIFIFECLSKIITYGFFWCEGSYLRDGWSILDFFIVCTSILDMMLKGTSVQFLGVLKIVRTLRPLRILSHNPGLKIVIQCLFQSFNGIMNVGFVVLMFWLMYAILGMNLLSGKLGFCNFPDQRNYFYVNKTMCPDLGGTWAIRGCNFENVFKAISALFVFSNAENWNTYTYYWLDGDDASNGPSPKANSYIVFYSLIIVFTSTFFLTKLFVGVIYSEFVNEQEKVNRQNFRVVSDDQIKWIQMQKMIRAATPNYVEIIIPQNKFRLFFYKIVNSQYFEWFILTMISFNMLVLAMIYNNMNPFYSNLLTDIGFLFTTVFILECIMKIVSFGMQPYIASNWNKFDFFIVLISILDIVLTNFVNIQGVSIYPIIGRIMRILRVTRFFKIMKSKSFEGINKIIKTLFYSIPAILNVSLVLFLVYFIYAVLGVFLFKGYDPAFENFLQSIIFLFKCSTGEAWPDFMYNDEEYNAITAGLFWHSYIFLTTFTLMNLFMSVIIDQFSNFYFNESNPINSFEEIVEEFRVCWLLFTANEKGDKIKSKDVLNFFICLKSPLGFHIPIKKEKPSVYAEDFSITYFINTLKFDMNYVRLKISEMKLIEDKQSSISFGQVLHAAMKNAFGKNCYTNSKNDTYKEIRRIELKTIAKIFNKKIDNYEVTLDKTDNKKKIHAKRANPFNSVLFSQMLFEIWYNHAKLEVGNDDVSSADLENLLNKNPDRQFENQILKDTKQRVNTTLGGFFSRREKND